MKRNLLLLLPYIMLATANDPFYTGNKNDSFNEGRYNLPCWNVNGHIIYAKDEKTAIKYAKKRGFWISGTIVEKLD